MFIILVLGIVLFLYFKNSNSNKVKEESNLNLVKEEQKDVIIPGLRIMNIDDNSPLKHVGLVSLNAGYGYGDESLLVKDIITGVSIDYDKTNYRDIILRKTSSKYFIPVNSERELYSEINKLGNKKIILGIVRKVEAGTGYDNRPDLATISLEKLEGNYLGVSLSLNTKELSQ